tara:strand:- start:424 stop:759 length:336 start_codon:yes stop_codon:yes gene_type:complete
MFTFFSILFLVSAWIVTIHLMALLYVLHDFKKTWVPSASEAAVLFSCLASLVILYGASPSYEEWSNEHTSESLLIETSEFEPELKSEVITEVTLDLPDCPVGCPGNCGRVH